GCFLFFAMASAGLPGQNNFVGEFLILAGTFRGHFLAASLAFVGIILPLVYTVRLLQELLFQTERRELPMADLGLREGTLLGVMMLCDLYIGLHPAPLLDLLNLPVGLLTGGP
ncbi:MAG TPA: NADH-quinone oxidoreductase subunit M, partial [Geobacteraceae bacterium]